MPRFLLISPSPPWDADFAGFRGADGTVVTRVPPVAIATVAALAPAGIDVTLLDESIDPVDFDAPADFVGITANVSQVLAARRIAEGFRARGRTVIVGGPHVTLDPSAFAGLCDVAVLGEFEGVAEAFYADMLAGRLRPLYHGGRPDLTTSPVPAWRLYDNRRALFGVAQTSRGCPFECNYCDVIQYVGRKQRHKTDAQVLAEVQQLYDVGYNQIFLADDNLTVYRKRAAGLLAALADWNGRGGRGWVTFGTQVSIDICADDAMLDLCARAGLLNLFIGVETVNEDSLRDSLKRQNLGADMAARIGAAVDHGLQVVAALMVGFDADGPDIFRRQYEFGMSLPVGTFKVSTLVAPVSTPLYDQMAAAGRIVDDPAGSHFPGGDGLTNIVPARMTRDELRVGSRWLVSRLCSPDAFLERLDAMFDRLRPHPLEGRAHRHEPPERALSGRLFMQAMVDMSRRDPAVARAIREVDGLMRRRPDLALTLSDLLHAWLLTLHGQIARGGYDPAWARLPEPPFEPVRRAG